MNNQDLLSEIEKWNTHFGLNTNIDNVIYELAFFKIFIKFEKFLSDTFECYATGTPSIHNYCPDRRLNFDDLEHLNKVIKKDNSFINHFDVIKNISDCFFTNNPFEIIKSDANYSSTVNTMKYIRNYIAHESTTARNKYVKNVLNDRGFIEPYEHLLSIKRSTNKSFYNYYITSIIEISNFIVRTPPVDSS